MKYDLFVRERTVINPEPSRSLVQNGIAVDALKCHFDDEWESYDSIYAVFTNETDDTSVTVEAAGDEIEVPANVLQTAGRVYVSLVGYEGGERRAVTRLMGSPFTVDESGALPSESTSAEAEDILARMLTIVEEMRELVAGLTGSDEEAGE